MLPLTVLLVAGFPTVGGWPRWVVAGLGVCSLLYRPWLREPFFWFANAALLGIDIFDLWAVTDNHKYLMAYWCLTLGFVHTLPEARRREAVATSAALLLGLCMALAVGWKLATPAYREGTFFRWTLLTDPRFRYLACWLGDVPLEVQARNRAAMQQLARGHLSSRPVDSVNLVDAPRLRLLAVAMTWWTVAIEAGLALVFLWPLRRGGTRLQTGRDLLLLVFVCTTYPVAPVIPFGWLLLLMGLAQSRDGMPRLRMAYLAAILLLGACRLPYQAALHQFAGIG